MGKTCKGKDKAKAKVAAAKRKIARKVKASVAVMVAILGLVLANGCSTSESAQPAKSQTQNNSFEDCVIVIATQATVSNRVVRADGTTDVPAVELFTMAQSQESSGTESFAQTATQTPTTDIKPDIDVKYNDAIAAASATSKGILETLTQSGMEKVLSLMSSGGSGQVTVEKKDGGQAVVTCEGGQCTTCKDCTP